MSKYFNKHYWIRKLFVNRLFSKLLSKKFLNKIVFNSIYKSNYWNKSKSFNSDIQSYSGPGSIPNSVQTNSLITNLEKFFLNNNIKKILDAPCGDCAWVEKIFKLNIQYTGIDIVNELILTNKEKFKKNKNVNFYCEDLTVYDKFDNYDFILLRDFFIHLPLKTIENIIVNLKKSNCKYFAFNNYENININKEISTGQHRKINLIEKPFNLEKPFTKIQEIKNENFPDKDIMDNFLYIYKNRE